MSIPLCWRPRMSIQKANSSLRFSTALCTSCSSFNKSRPLRLIINVDRSGKAPVRTEECIGDSWLARLSPSLPVRSFPELDTKLRLIPFSTPFKTYLTVDAGWSSKSSTELSVASGRKTSLPGGWINLKGEEKRRQEREASLPRKKLTRLIGQSAPHDSALHSQSSRLGPCCSCYSTIIR
jgi:hypothetical protein